MIEFKNVSKSFGKVQALKDVSAELEKGKVTACIGPNGSGKTTLIKSILGLVKVSAGAVYFDGKEIGQEADYREKIGYMPQEASFPENLRVNELIEFIQRLRRRDDADPTPLIERFALRKDLRKKTSALSGGTRQKVSALLALLFNPQLLVLDEPTAGLDPLSSTVLKDCIRRERARGTTAVITSHMMGELQELADNVLVLMDGRVCYSGPLTSILNQTRQMSLEAAVASLMKEVS